MLIALYIYLLIGLVISVFGKYTSENMGPVGRFFAFGFCVALIMVIWPTIVMIWVYEEIKR